MIKITQGRMLMILILLIAIGTRLHAQDHQPTPLTMNIHDALNIAMTESNTIKIADQEVTKSKYDRWSAISHLFPSLDLKSDYNVTLKKQVLYFGSQKMMIPGMPPGAARMGIPVGRNYAVSGGITFGLPLINAKLWSSIQLSREAVELSLLQGEKARAELYTNVVKAFYGTLLAEQTVKVLRESYKAATETYKDICKKYDLGLVAEYDKLRANVAVQNIEPALQEAVNTLEQAKRQLKILLSLDLNQEITCTGTLSDKEQELYESYINSEGLTLNNIQMRIMDQQIALLKSKEHIALSDFLPTLSIGGFYKINASDDAFSWKDYHWTPFSVIQVSLSFPLFSGGGRWSQWQKAKIERSEALLHREDLYKSLNAEYLQYEGNMKTAVKQFVSAKSAVAQAEKGYKIAKKRYDIGGSTLIELNDANVALLQARLNYYKAIYDFITNRTDLQRIAGTLPLQDFK